MRTCLVVDDSRVVRTVARRILERLRFDVLEAGDGAEALALCRRGMPALVLLDWDMPVMDGMAFLRRLRSEPSGDGPRVLMCTSRSDPEQIGEALSAGADEYVMKPFDSEIIELKLAETGLV